MNKLKAFLLLGLICVILAGCSNVFAKKDYYDTNKIAAVEDRYAKKNSASNSNDSGYLLNVEEFNGRETVWTKTLEKSEDFNVEVKLSLAEGIVKIVHVDEMGNVTTIIECTPDNCVENTMKTVSLGNGINRIKVVGYRCRNIELKLSLLNVD